LSSSRQQFDLIVIGSGAAGEGAIDQAQRSRHSIAIVEKNKVGGDCPNYACVPTKALLRSAKIYSLLKRAEAFGLSPSVIDFDWSRVMARKEQIVRSTGEAATAERYRQAGIGLIKGTATFADEHQIRVDGQVFFGDKIMIATGSKPERPALPGLNEAHPITSVEAISLPKLPVSLIILGGGPVGCEFAQLFSTFAVRVTLLQKAPTLLPREEPELSHIIQQALEANGVTVVTKAEVQRVDRDAHGKTVHALIQGQARAFRAEEILLATGREPQTAELNLTAAGIHLAAGRVQINEYLQTTCPHIYAGGDVAGPFQFTNFAHYQGTLAGLNMFADEPRPADYRVVPRVTFTDPEIASVGLTEEQARQAGHRVITGKVEIRAVGRALVDSEDRGLVKLVADAASEEILGGHIVAPAAGEMIHEIVAAMKARATIRVLAEAIHAYPTFAEGVKLAADDWLKTRVQ